MGTEEQIIEPLEATTRIADGGSKNNTNKNNGNSGGSSSSGTTGGTGSGESIEEHCRLQEEELQTLRESENRLKLQYEESQRRERILIRKYALKEQEIQDYVAQIAELKTAQLPTATTLRSTLLDPAVNIIIQKLKTELQTTKARLEETQNELSAWKFTPDSNTGKRLMAKCRLLYQENEELGKMTSNGRLAKLEGDLALQKSFSEEVKKSQSELDDLIQELDEDVEGMQSTILFLQQELKASKEAIVNLERENVALKNGGGDKSSTSNGTKDDDEHNNDDDDDDDNVDGKSGGDHKNSNNTATGSSGGSGSGSGSENIISGDIAVLLNGTTNCSVVLSDKDVRLHSERILRKDKLNNINNKNEPRKLRSSTRNISGGGVGGAINSCEDLRTATAKHRLSGGSNDEKCNGNNADSSTLVNNFTKSNDKRTYSDVGDDDVEIIDDDDDEDVNDISDNSSESSNCTNGRNKIGGSGGGVGSNVSGGSGGSATKKLRRSSVLSIDLNEEDSQIEMDDERTIVTATAAEATATKPTLATTNGSGSVDGGGSGAPIKGGRTSGGSGVVGISAE